MDGSLFTQRKVRVTVSDNEFLRIFNPNGPERPRMKPGTVLEGHETLIGESPWFIFPEERGFGLSLDQLREAWDDMTVDAVCIINEDGTEEELFT